MAGSVVEDVAERRPVALGILVDGGGGRGGVVEEASEAAGAAYGGGGGGDVAVPNRIVYHRCGYRRIAGGCNILKKSRKSKEKNNQRKRRNAAFGTK